MTSKENKNSKFEIKDSEVSGQTRVSQEQTSTDKTRRTALLGAVGVAGAAGLPSEWKKPIIDGLLLPAHAQMSPTTSTSAVTSNTATGTGTSTMTSTMTSSSSMPTMTSTMTSTTSGTTIQTSTVTTQGTASRTVLITDGTAACSDFKYQATIIGNPVYNEGTTNGGEFYGATVSYVYSEQVLCVDNLSNTTEFSTDSFGFTGYLTFPAFSPSGTISGVTSQQSVSTAQPLTNVSYTLYSTYTVSGTATVSGTVTISG